MGQKLGERLGQPFIVENRPGGGTTVAAQAVVDASADGYTLLLSNIASNGAAPAVVKSARYDPVGDFTHVALVGTSNLVLVASAKSAVHTMADIQRIAKEKNGIEIGISANGGTSHLAGLRLASLGGFKLNNIPYRGSGPAQVAVLTGEVALMVDAVVSQLPHVKSGAVRPIAVLSAKRDASLPDTPTAAELGLALDSEVWYGISGPKNLPAEITAQLNREINAILKLPDVRKRYAELSASAPESTSVQFTAFVAKEVAAWRDIVKANNLSVD
ncbi:tripartite tricarboxylate transporter substrate-binding protein [Comamonadaceae bacterium G21597-S1]|nr:tripartite tricarboxylate transporter substrate-binding protein [Comamonadaceae bacterium G21597-S1]